MRMQINLIVLTLIFLLMSASFGNGQISQPGTPPGLDENTKPHLTSNIPKKVLPPVNEDSLRKEDSIERAQPKPIPQRYGYPMEVNWGIDNAGVWDTLPDGKKVWRLKLKSPGAKSINFLFEEYVLPESAELGSIEN